MQVLDEIQVLWRYDAQEAMHGVERGECEAMLTVEQSNRFIIAKGLLSAYEALLERWIMLTFVDKKGRDSDRFLAGLEDLV